MSQNQALLLNVVELAVVVAVVIAVLRVRRKRRKAVARPVVRPVPAAPRVSVDELHDAGVARHCPRCHSSIPFEATVCGHCTRELARWTPQLEQFICCGRGIPAHLR